MSAFVNRAETDRRDRERRQHLQPIGHAERRAAPRRGYVDRRTDPVWRARWLRTQVIAALREAPAQP